MAGEREEAYRLAMEAGWPHLREGQIETQDVERRVRTAVDVAWDLAVAAGRREAAQAIRSYLASQQNVRLGVPPPPAGMASDHAYEHAARVAEAGGTQ